MVNRETGELLVADSNALDFESNPTLNFNVRATNGTTELIDVTIDLVDQAE